ncbi:hypothetical protein C1H46_024870 [Malus baccata]|uniref:SAC domain-containing protein n=1 Tax=Malus baccata TaxID=106549 RepID=A0A540LST1_MALBA|nr:hypothetical protein C1H46_024870 [Malus baccata]
MSDQAINLCYLKRGVNDRGRVANDVETEQIILDEEGGSCKGKMSTVVQMRGSIPLFWSQEASRFGPKPDILLQRYDPTYQATKLHFEDLAMRYGNRVIVLNLIKNLLRREPLKLVYGSQSHRTFVYINDAIEAVMLMIVRNLARANGHIFNVGNPHNEVTVRQLGEMMTEVKSSL